VSARDTAAEVATLVRQTLALPDSEPIQPQQLIFCFGSSNTSRLRSRKELSITLRAAISRKLSLPKMQC
jgi:hypothetical protein